MFHVEHRGLFMVLSVRYLNYWDGTRYVKSGGTIPPALIYREVQVVRLRRKLESSDLNCGYTGSAVPQGVYGYPHYRTQT